MEPEELGILSSSGSKILNPLALKYTENIRKIKIASPGFRKGTEIEFDEPGVIKKIVTPIAKEGINIWEILTVHTDIMIFVEEKDAEKNLKF